MTTAVVVGGGVAGPVAAMALQRIGCEATVYEAHPGPADDVGAFLTLQVNGVAALGALGAADAVAGIGFPTTSMRFRSGTGKLLGEVGTGEPLADGTEGVTVRRGELYRALRDEALSRGIRVEHGKRLVGAATTTDGVRAEFADGSVVHGDLLIGADGIRSQVRAAIDPTAAPARYVPVLNAGGYAPSQPTDARPGQFEMVFGKRSFFLYTVAPDGTVWWGANPPRHDEPAPGELAATPPERVRAQLLELFARDRGPMTRIIESTPAADLARLWPTYDIPTVRTWHRDRMVIIGDAAHATSPSSGQGASMAIEDAVELARCLRDLPVEDAFRAFEGLRRDRVERVVAQGAQTSRQKAAGPVKRVLRDAFLPIFLKRAAGQGSGSVAWLHQYHIDWDAQVR